MNIYIVSGQFFVYESQRTFYHEHLLSPWSIAEGQVSFLPTDMAF
jgi:hypothetical protein